jgi:hypothetical protein
MDMTHESGIMTVADDRRYSFKRILVLATAH